MQTDFSDLLHTAPLTAVVLFSLIVLLTSVLPALKERAGFWIAAAGLAVTLSCSLTGIAEGGTAYGGIVRYGGYADFCAAVFSLSGLLSVMLARSYFEGKTDDIGEFYSLILLAVAGMILMASALDLVVLFLGLELMSVAFYVLAGFRRSSLLSNEAALKYFLLGAFATGFLLYGIAMVYGSTGSTGIDTLAQGVEGDAAPLFLIGLALLLIGLVFKVAAVPFHMWVPDVYEGAPTPVTGFMATAGKAAAFSAFLLVFVPATLHDSGTIRDALAIVAALSMIVGNILALAQDNVKRMLAYSSIAHAGYILTGLVSANPRGQTGVLFYIFSYTVMSVGAFGVVSVFEGQEGKKTGYEGYAGLSSSHPLLAGLMALFMFSLTGLPPFAGFFAKYYVFAGVIEGGYTWLAVLGVLTSLISVYYYLRLVVLMYFRPELERLEGNVSGLGLAAIIASAGAVVIFGMYPSPLLDITSRFF